MKTKYKKKQKKRNVTNKRKLGSTRRQRHGGVFTNKDLNESNEFAISDGREYNIKEVTDSYTFEGKAVAIVSFQNCGANSCIPPDITYRMTEGKMVMQDGTTYEGTFDENENKMYGKLVIPYPGEIYKKITYVGPFKDNKMSGNGQMILEDGGRYTGDFSDDVFHGKGRLEYSGGDIYEGDWKNDKMDGFGKYTTLYGKIVYEGEWQNDRKHGTGTMMNHDTGIRYVGTWENDKKHNGKEYKPGRLAASAHYVKGKRYKKQ